MYFASTVPDAPLFAAELWESLQRLKKKSSTMQVFALVDMAFDGKLSRRVRHGRKGIAIAATTPLSTLAEHLPHLQGPINSQGMVEFLLENAGGKPMLSFVASELEAGLLAQALKPLLLVETDDGKRWPLRFADTRVLPELLVLANETGLPMPAGIASWWWPDRRGKLGVSVPEEFNAEQTLFPDHLRFDDAQFARMLNAAQPDAVIDQLHRACPDILDRCPPHENFSKVRQALNKLPALCRDSSELDIRWSSLALSFDKPLWEIDWFHGALKESQSTGELLARLDGIPDNVWEQAVNEAVQ